MAAWFAPLSSLEFEFSVIARPFTGPPLREALLPTPVGASRFVIRATHERGVGVPPSRSLATATREATLILTRGGPGHGHIVIGGGLAAISRTRGTATDVSGAAGGVVPGFRRWSDSACRGGGIPGER